MLDCSGFLSTVGVYYDYSNNVVDAATINLIWNTSLSDNNKYYINVSTTSETIMEISTKFNNVLLALEYRKEYLINVYKFCCGARHNIGNISVPVHNSTDIVVHGSVFSAITSNEIKSSIATLGGKSFI